MERKANEESDFTESEGLCVFIIRSRFIMLLLDLSKLRNREASLGTLIISATLQFLPQTIKKLGDISYLLFTKFQDFEAFLPPPMYVNAVEISQTRYINFTNKIDFDVSPNFAGYPPNIPLYHRFEKEEGGFTIHNMNDSSVKYSEDILKYLDIIWEYTSEDGIRPMKPPIVVGVAKGFVKVE
ncbi:hypothetical protein P3S68_028568 [Capsicum galapagoense]